MDARRRAARLRDSATKPTAMEVGGRSRSRQTPLYSDVREAGKCGPQIGHSFNQVRICCEPEHDASAALARNRGPFGAEVNALLTSCFGQPLEDITVSRGDDASNAAIGALASTHGSHISLSSLVSDELDHPASMEVIAHEVAHALAPRGSPVSYLDRVGDPGERAAQQAGRGFRQYVESGTAGPAPQLHAAHGGQAVVQRFESFEHKDAVDSTVEILRRREGRPGGGEVDPNVARQLEQTIRLANGMEVTPGEITAMMGDFYGKWDKEGNFDPRASFEQLNNADPDEMQALREAFQREERGEEIAPSEWEAITRNRRSENGERSYLELAERNNSHFSAPTMEGTNNNMGAYTTFHQMALQMAESGDAEQARALEACGMHYLTDRHAGGHNMEKSGVLEASGYDPTGVIANMFVKAVHDDMNTHGVTVTNAAGESWLAQGDAHWNDELNRENQRRTAESVYGSWSELNDVLSGTRSSDEVAQSGYTAQLTVPQWDQQRQEGAEQTARNLTLPDIAWQYGADAPGGLLGRATRWYGEGENAVSDAYDWVAKQAGDTYDWAGETASDAYDWAGETAGDAYDWLGDTAGEAYNWAGETASDAYDFVGEKATAVSDWAGDTVDSASRKLDDVCSWLGL